MDFNHLVYFQAVAKTENITKAAQHLHIAQPSLSKTISKLEEDLGVTLFDREANTIRLNDCGRAFLKRVNRILLEIQDARNELHELSSGEAGHVYFAAAQPEMLNDLVKTYIIDHPKVCIHQLQATAEQIHTMLLNGEIDFALSSIPIIDPSIEWTQIMAEKVGIIVSKENPLSSSPTHRLGDLMSQPIIVNSNVDQQIFVRTFFESEGLTQNIVFEGDQPEVIGHLISKNHGIGFSSKRRYESLRKSKTYENDDSHIMFCDIDPPIYLTIGVCIFKDHYLSPATRHFYQYIIKNLHRDNNAI